MRLCFFLIGESLKISTLNVRSLADHKKRSCIKEWLWKNHMGIMFLQETHSTEGDVKKWSKEWNSMFYCSHGNTKSKGVAIVIPNEISHDIKNVFNDEEGRIIAIECNIANEAMLLINCYFPTKDKQSEQIATLNQLRDIITPFADKTIILGGDFNLVLDETLDKQGGVNATIDSKKFRIEMKAFIEAFVLTDCLRIKNENKKLFTWSSKHLKVKSRLDYIFISESLLNRLIKCEKKTSILTDHSLVQLTLQHSVMNRGPGFWKFNTSLLRDKKYVTLVKETIKETVSRNTFSNKGLMWDMIKMNIRAVTVQYSASKKRENINLEKQIMCEINKLEKQGDNEKVENQLDLLKEELENILQIKADGAAIRARAEWVEDGEKNTAYFLNLEKHKCENKTISQLQTANGKILEDPKDILQEQYDFYSNLYKIKKENAEVKTKAENIFLKNEIPQLTETEKDKCEGLLKLTECLKALKTMKNNKSPGSDGFSAEFYKFFWRDISQYLMDSVNYAFCSGEISIDQKRGLITLIPKKDKDRIFLKNWRPIALLNTDYKIMAKALALRLKEVIENLVSSDQKGYIKGRYIGENIRTVADTIHYLKDKKMEALILLIDFEKAFDSISWDFMDKTLNKFNFGTEFRKWIKVLYCNSESAVLNNGYFTRFFKLERGVRQGCPLSAYLFLLVVELLACEIRCNTAINGIPLKNNELKISQMADDTTIFLNNSKSIPILLQLLEQFALCSGLNTNVEKTKAYSLGINNLKKSSHGLQWEKGPIKFLGITITDDIKTNFEENFLPKIKLMKNLLGIWSRRNLSLKGKIVIINALIVSLFVYPATIMETSEELLEQINTALFEFLWNWKKPKIAKSVIQGQLDKGGLKMPNIFMKVKAWKLSWLKRAAQHKDFKWVEVLNTILGNINFCHLTNCNFIKGNKEIGKLPQFYQEILKDWINNINNSENMPQNAADVQNQMIWLNREITIEKKPFLWDNWYEKGVIYVRQLLNKKSQFLTPDEMLANYGIKCNFLQMLQIKQAIPLLWRKMISKVKTVIEYTTSEFFITHMKTYIAIEKMSSQLFYWILMEKIIKTPACISKWQNALELEDINWKHTFLNPFKICKESMLQSFQFKLLHRIIPCNHWLYVMKIKDSPDCTFCNTDDNLIHYFAECERVQPFWKSFEKWWINISSDLGKLDIKTVLLGAPTRSNKADLFNYCLILAKMYVHKSKIKSEIGDIDFYRFLSYLKSKLVVEELNAALKDNCHEFEMKFGLVYNNL